MTRLTLVLSGWLLAGWLVAKQVLGAEDAYIVSPIGLAIDTLAKFKRAF